MSSYKPVIYTFAAIGLVSFLAFGALAIQGMRQASHMMANPDDYMMMMDENGRMMASSSMDMDRSLNLEDTGNDIGMETMDDSYLGQGVLYATMRDKSVMMELKLPDAMDQELRTILTRPDTSSEEIYRSDRRLALRVTALGDERHLIVVQNLENGEIYRADMDGRRNFVLNGSKMVFVAPMALPTYELNSVFVYDIEKNQTDNIKTLSGDVSFTKKIDENGPIGELSLKNGKVEIKVYSTKTDARFDTDRTFVRAETY